MKKLLFVFLVAVILFVGCESVKNPSVRGRKYVNENDYEELLYEWEIDDENKIIRRTQIYVYVDAPTKTFEEKQIDCENYKRQGSLYNCVVKKETGKVIYEEVHSKDQTGTKEDIIKFLKESGYEIVE